MPPVIAAVATIGASIAIKALAVSALVKALLTVAVTVAISLLAQRAMRQRIDQGMELSTKFDTNMTRQVLAGYVATGGSVHFTWTQTDDPKKPNRYLYRVIQLSDRPINALKHVFEGANELTFDGDLTTGWRGCNQHKDKSGATKFWMRAYLGSDSPTADATLISETGGAWTSAHKGTGLAYVIFKMDYDADAFSGGEPDLTFYCEGAKVYDDRADGSTGGVGPQRLNNYSTWLYHENTALVIAQFMRGFYTNGVLIAGVQAEERDLSKSMLYSAYNTCDQLVEDSTGFNPRYTCGIILSATENAADILVDLQSAMDGKIFDRGGAITLLPGANHVPAMELTDQDIVWTAEKSWQPKASLERMLNHITANFVDAERGFQERALPVLKNAQWEIDDGNERFTEFYSFRAIIRWAQGQRTTKRMHQASRYSGTVSFVGPLWLLEMEQGDWFTLTSERWGFTEKYFEVQEFDFTSDARVVVIGREVSPDTDNWDWAVDERDRDDSIYFPPEYTLPVPSIYATAYKTTDPTSGAETFNIEMGLSDDPALYGSIVKYIHWQYVIDDVVTGTIMDHGLMPVTQGKTSLLGLAPGSTYYVRAATSDGARHSDFSDWEEVLTDNGAALAAGYGFFLSNPSVGIVANSDGTYNPAQLTDAGGQFYVMQGGAFVPATYSVLSESGVDMQIHASTGVYSVVDFPNASLRGIATFRAVVGAITIDLRYDISKSLAGSDGDPVYGVVLSNDSHGIQTDADGLNGNFTNAFGNALVYDGVSNIVSTVAVTVGTATAVGCTGTVNTALNTPVSGQAKGYYRVTAMSADVGYLDIPITVGGVTYTKRFSVQKNRGGGSLRLWGNRDAINYDSNGAANPSLQTTTFNVTPFNTDNTGISWEIAQIGGGFVSATGFITILTALTASMTRAQFEAVASTTQGVVVKAVRTVGGVLMSDTWTVVKVQQGASAKALKVWASATGVAFDGNGVATPSVQTTTFVAEKVNTTTAVTWSVTDLAGNPKTPVSSYLTNSTTDTPTMSVAQFNSARGSTDGVNVKATLTDIVTLTDAITLMKVAQGAAAVGFVQDSPVPTSTYLNQTWYRPTTKEWFRASSVGCSGVGGSCWLPLLGALSTIDKVDTINIDTGAINYGDWIKQGSSIVMTNETFETTSVMATIPIEGARVMQRFNFVYEIQKVNPVQGDEYSFTVEGLIQRVSSGAKTYSSYAQNLSERWATASETGTRYFGKRIGMLEFYFEGVASANYTLGYRVVVPAGFTVTFFPYRYSRIDDMRATS